MCVAKQQRKSFMIHAATVRLETSTFCAEVIKDHQVQRSGRKWITRQANQTPGSKMGTLRWAYTGRSKVWICCLNPGSWGCVVAAASTHGAQKSVVGEGPGKRLRCVPDSRLRNSSRARGKQLGQSVDHVVSWAKKYKGGPVLQFRRHNHGCLCKIRCAMLPSTEITESMDQSLELDSSSSKIERMSFWLLLADLDSLVLWPKK